MNAATPLAWSDFSRMATGRLVVLLGWLLPLGKIHSKFMREVLENLERETGRRAGSPRSRG